ncbi:hypothetical protein B0H17DRAFT_1208945 [Mycena rosella]|uniref:Uncharacterized protein n=1 Tax=Mycena rosella TaxID=1033263 RepID=A0AAD7G6Q7_MYCRO|nr:hypothetical protein B0H17DRAFT_1208945 [Mycena rosella]
MAIVRAETHLARAAGCLLTVTFRGALPSPLVDVFFVTSSLHKLTLNGNLSNAAIGFRLPWSQITEYAADSDYNREHFAMLALLKTNPALRRLYVNRGCILDLDLPQLEEFTFEPLDTEVGWEDPLQNLSAFLALSRPPLTKLCLIGPDYSDVLLVDVLRQTPAFVDLCIQCRHNKTVETVDLAEVADFLHVGDEIHLPALQTVTFGGYGFEDYAKPGETVESRWRHASCPLTSFGLITRLEIGQAAAAKFKTLQTEGL